ncbi:MAG TPA: lipocalin-like domain-containing protein [Kofleriaceae bacterium]|nr:lipocalin-like domain-containing protein [Kofleriaceae bacterium]
MNKLPEQARWAPYPLAAAAILSAALAGVAGCAGWRSPVEGAPSLAGTWTLVAADDLLPDGRRVPAYGPSPRGRLMIDEGGRYSLQLFRSGRPRFASGDKRRGTAAEYEGAVLGMSTHSGRCAIDPGGRTITFRIELAAFPNWEGTVQVRQFTLAGDELSYRQPAGPSGRVPISVWRRVSARSDRAGPAE